MQMLITVRCLITVITITIRMAVTIIIYQKGKVVALGIFSDDVIDNATFNKFFDNLLTKYATSTAL